MHPKVGKKCCQNIKKVIMWSNTTIMAKKVNENVKISPKTTKKYQYIQHLGEIWQKTVKVAKMCATWQKSGPNPQNMIRNKKIM